MINYAVCVPKSLAPEKLVAAAAIAAEINPVNHPPPPSTGTRNV